MIHSRCGLLAALSLSLLREAAGTRAFWVIAGTFFICGLSTSGTVQQHFIPLCADYGVAMVTAASLLAVMGVFNFIGTVASGPLPSATMASGSLVFNRIPAVRGAPGAAAGSK